MFQYFNPALYSNKHKFNFIHALKNFANHNKDLYYKENSGLPLSLGYNHSFLEMKKKVRKKGALLQYFIIALIFILGH